MKTILVVDDDVYIGDMLEEVLHKEGYGVLRAYSGSEALLLLASNRPDAARTERGGSTGSHPGDSCDRCQCQSGGGGQSVAFAGRRGRLCDKTVRYAGTARADCGTI